MDHQWNKLFSQESDHTCMPVSTETWEQCRLCRTVRKTYEHGPYWSTKAYRSVQYSLGEGLILTQPPCLEAPTNEIELRNEVRALQIKLDDLARKVCVK